MNTIGKLLKDFASWAEQQWNEEAAGPLKVSIMGQTGVGKSSLINTLFGTHLQVDPVSPGTLDIEERHVNSKAGHDVVLYDLPGIGESQGTDEKYLKDYKQKLLESDVVIWAILADSRSFTFDREALDKTLHTMDEELRTKLMSKIIFVLTKVDLFTPADYSPWIFYHDDNEGVFAMTPPSEELLRKKERYAQEAFIEPFKNFIRSQIPCPGKFDVKDPRIHYDRSVISFHGSLNEEERDRLKELHPKSKGVFDRLYDQCRVISCSSRFRYNLDLIMNVITDKLDSRSAGQFGGFVVKGRMDRVPLEIARTYINILLVDESSKHNINDSNGRQNGHMEENYE